MASVYKAQDILLDRIVAVKVLHAKYGDDHDFCRSFRQEASGCHKLSHPNIVNIYDVGYDENVHYIVMNSYGETLKRASKNTAICDQYVDTDCLQYRRGP